MQGKLQSACRFITERDGGVRVMSPEEDAGDGKTVFEGLLDKNMQSEWKLIVMLLKMVMTCHF